MLVFFQKYIIFIRPYYTQPFSRSLKNVVQHRQYFKTKIESDPAKADTTTDVLRITYKMHHWNGIIKAPGREKARFQTYKPPMNK